MNKKTKKLFISVALITIISVIFYIAINERTNKLLASTADARIKARITSLSNNCIIDIMLDNPALTELIDIETDMDGNVSAVKANSVRLNLLSYKTAECIQKELDIMQQQDISINWLALFGSDLFSGMGPSITVNVKPIGNVETKYISEFASAGINQTRHRIYLEIKCNVSVIMPAGDKNTEIISQVMVSECIVVGEVPNSYVYVDETDKMLNLIPD